MIAALHDWLLQMNGQVQAGRGLMLYKNKR